MSLAFAAAAGLAYASTGFALQMSMYPDPLGRRPAPGTSRVTGDIGRPATGAIGIWLLSHGCLYPTVMAQIPIVSFFCSRFLKPCDSRSVASSAGSLKVSTDRGR